LGVGFIDRNHLNCQRDNLELVAGHMMSHPSALFAMVNGLSTPRHNKDWN
jgi:hypothetical protein